MKEETAKASKPMTDAAVVVMRKDRLELGCADEDLLLGLAEVMGCARCRVIISAVGDAEYISAGTGAISMRERNE